MRPNAARKSRKVIQDLYYAVSNQACSSVAAYHAQLGRLAYSLHICGLGVLCSSWTLYLRVQFPPMMRTGPGLVDGMQRPLTFKAAARELFNDAGSPTSQPLMFAAR